MGKSFVFLKNLLLPQQKVEESSAPISILDHKQFSYETLSSATNKFHSRNKLGQGGFGPVFKGKLPDGREIAVKKLCRMSNQGKKQFENEAKLLACVQHRNVVTLYGFCSDEEEMLLVYEFVANVSLDKTLFCKILVLFCYVVSDCRKNPKIKTLDSASGKGDQLDWSRRFEIIVGVARGLLYLHDHTHKRIIHRDIKASNILLDEKWSPKIADFGMARLFENEESSVLTRLVGTNGYMAPEYALHGTLSVKADVFSFGVVVLEIIAGRRNFSPVGHCGETLLEKMYDLHLNDRSLEMVDPRLEVVGEDNEIKHCIHIGLLCTQGDRTLRPEMSRVVLLLSKKSSKLEQPAWPGVPGAGQRSSKAKERSGKSGSSGSGVMTGTLFTSTGLAISSSRSIFEPIEGSVPATPSDGTV